MIENVDRPAAVGRGAVGPVHAHIALAQREVLRLALERLRAALNGWAEANGRVPRQLMGVWLVEIVGDVVRGIFWEKPGEGVLVDGLEDGLRGGHGVRERGDMAHLGEPARPST